MQDIQDILGRFKEQRRQWADRIRSEAPTAFDPFNGPAQAAHLIETPAFGSNPGALRMFTHIPQPRPDNCALVVVLHGCTQSAASYDLGAGWSTLADRYGFALLLPQQQRANNPNGCFNWFQPEDTERARGEALSIRQMVEKAISDHGIDRSRVFITGLSAGGAMTSAMLAIYPEVFAGGAIIAGLPYGAASNLQQAFETMYRCPPRAAREWGDLVRRASPHQGPWPRVSVWHGGADATVVPSNATEIVKQWTAVHGLPALPSARTTVDGFPRQVWLDAAGDEVIECYTIPQMAHGTPLATGDAANECGVPGPFLLDVGISSSYHIAKFFGLTRRESDHEASTRTESSPAREPRNVQRDPIQPEKVRAVQPYIYEGEVLDRETDEQSKPKSRPLPIDIGAVITSALRAAGLMKGN